MTTRQHTKLVLNEFIGTALAIGAIAGGLYGAKKQLDAGAAKGTGLRFRVGERLKTGIGEKLANNGREALMKYSDKMQTDAHDKIATAYGMSSRRYAEASIEQNLKAKAQEALNKTSGQDIHIHDLDNVIAGRPTQHGVPTPAQAAFSAIHHANIMTSFELQDLTNPIAARFRKDMNTRIFAPQQAPRERLTTQIANSPQFLKNKAVPLEADRQQQKRDLAVKRANMPDPLARGIAPKERFKRILKRTFQKSVDDLRTIV
jgi:hypothetical protein